MLFFCSVKLGHLKKERGGGGDVREEKSGHCGIWELVRRERRRGEEGGGGEEIQGGGGKERLREREGGREEGKQVMTAGKYMYNYKEVRYHITCCVLSPSLYQSLH